MTYYQMLQKVAQKFTFWYISASPYHKELFDKAYYDGYDTRVGIGYEQLAKLSDEDLIVYAHGYVQGSDDAYYEE